MSEHSSDTPPVCECGHDEQHHHDGKGVWAKGCNQPLAMELECPCEAYAPPAAGTPDEAKCENAKCQCGHDEFTYDANGNFWYCDKCERPCFAPQPTADAEGRAREKASHAYRAAGYFLQLNWDRVHDAFDRGGDAIVDILDEFTAAETSHLTQQLAEANGKVERLEKENEKPCVTWPKELNERTTCVWLKDGTKVRVRRGIENREAVWLEVVETPVIYAAALTAGAEAPE